jgi:hypothetical protein
MSSTRRQRQREPSEWVPPSHSHLINTFASARWIPPLPPCRAEVSVPRRRMAEEGAGGGGLPRSRHRESIRRQRLPLEHDR